MQQFVPEFADGVQSTFASVRSRMTTVFNWIAHAMALANAAILILALTSDSLAAERPNVLIITVDDMNCDSVGVYDCPLPNTTPNIDALARSALRFQFAHVQVGNCMPSRNVMWSGRYPHNNGVEGFYPVAQPDYPVLCDLARTAGYFTAIRHKISHSTPYHPFAWDLTLDVGPDGAKRDVKEAKSYGDATRQAIRAAHDAGKPFCALINVSDPHKPFYTQVKTGVDPNVPSLVFSAEQVPVPGFLPNDAAIREELALYYSSVRRADDCVGEVLKALDASGEAENTFVLFLSDHGMPLPFAKTQLYHHSTRTPLIIRWPGRTAPDSMDSQHMVSAVDFIPTLAEVMKFQPPQALDGRSFASLLQVVVNRIVNSWSRNTTRTLGRSAIRCAEFKPRSTCICSILGRMAPSRWQRPPTEHRPGNACLNWPRGTKTSPLESTSWSTAYSKSCILLPRILTAGTT